MEKTKTKYTLFTGKALFILILPIVIESALSMSLGLIDGLMVSHISQTSGDAPITAVNYVDQINNLIIQLFTAFGVGGAVITSQYLGANEVEEANKSAKQLTVLMLAVSLFLTVGCLVFHKQIINLFFGNLTEETLNYSYQYFFVTACSYPFLALNYSCAALLRAQRKSVNTMMSGAISFVLNVGFNALFIYVCNLGIIGAALGTLCARIFPAFFLLYLLSRKNNAVKIKVFEKFRFDGGMIKKIAKLGIPSGVENAFFQLGKILVLSFISLKIYETDGVNVHASANSVAMSLNSLGSIVGNGVNTATLTVIGQAVGAGIYDQVKFYIKRMFTISYIGNFCCVTLVWLLSPILIGAYDVTQSAAAIAQNIINICSIVQIFTYPLSFCAPAVLKANSDVKYTMVCSVISMVIMRVGLCYVLTTDLLPIQWGAYGLWTGMFADWVLRSALFLIRLISGKWKKASGLIKDQTEFENENQTAQLSAQTEGK